MVPGELRDAILRLERRVGEQVVRGERLRTKRGVDAARAVADHHERKQLNRRPALVLEGVANQQIVGHPLEHRIPLADAGLHVLENRVVRVLETQEVGRARASCGPERARSVLPDIRAGRELVVPERDLVGAVDVEVELQVPTCLY